MTRLALIGGTGLNRLPGLESLEEHTLTTPWGDISHAITAGRFGGAEIYFLARHGVPHRIAPHRINYRANIWALRELGVEQILAVFAVGGILESLTPGDIVIPDQIVDYTWGRDHSYHDDAAVTVEHIDFTDPYDAGMRQRLLDAAEQINLQCAPSATYAVTQGPRLETAAEIRRLRGDGCDIVGMTGMPEAALAAELGIPYAALCMVVNPAAGMSEVPITAEAIHQILEREALVIGELISVYLRALA